jgi:hypothetical protein
MPILRHRIADIERRGQVLVNVEPTIELHGSSTDAIWEDFNHPHRPPQDRRCRYPRRG